MDILETVALTVVFQLKIPTITFGHVSKSYTPVEKGLDKDNVGKSDSGLRAREDAYRLDRSKQFLIS